MTCVQSLLSNIRLCIRPMCDIVFVLLYGNASRVDTHLYYLVGLPMGKGQSLGIDHLEQSEVRWALSVYFLDHCTFSSQNFSY